MRLNALDTLLITKWMGYSQLKIKKAINCWKITFKIKNSRFLESNQLIYLVLSPVDSFLKFKIRK
jgi:hypothetical protein